TAVVGESPTAPRRGPPGPRAFWLPRRGPADTLSSSTAEQRRSAPAPAEPVAGFAWTAAAPPERLPGVPAVQPLLKEVRHGSTLPSWFRPPLGEPHEAPGRRANPAALPAAPGTPGRPRGSNRLPAAQLRGDELQRHDQRRG